ncbi:MAG: hypothetical protein CMP33_00060 [Rickettsiales bacterium]|nr:hypothetical protein [Rickettsiales bacterium]
MSISKTCNTIFKQVIDDYHLQNFVDANKINPFNKSNFFEKMIYDKCWIDTIQWHLEDIIRVPQISPDKALKIKRRIDLSNQDRTDMVEELDDYFFEKYSNSSPSKVAILNTETPAWAIDRLSILALKIYHMNEQANRKSASNQHRKKCSKKLEDLLVQRKNLSKAIDQLLENISKGRVIISSYKQMKMYNDDSLNPELYSDDD